MSTPAVGKGNCQVILIVSRTMSVHAAPAGVFEVQRADNLKRPRAIESDGAGYDDAATDSDVENQQAQEQTNDDDNEDALDDVDESVKEDMRQLEVSFPGISGKFRLVNRIGEGMFFFLLFYLLVNC